MLRKAGHEGFRVMEEELIKTLKELSGKLGHAPRLADVSDARIRMSAMTVFGSWSAALKSAGLKD